jgi:UDP-N-acetylglucosamine pyrophosphorylase
MRGTPGFLAVLQNQLESLPLEDLERVNRVGGLEVRDLLDFLLRPHDYTVDLPETESPDVFYEKIAPEAAAIGNEAIKNREVAICVLAGGVGTRIGMPKAFVKVPGVETSLLALKILQSESIEDVWVMSSPGNSLEIKKQLSLSKKTVKIFEQYETFRLTPDNQLYMTDGRPCFSPCGHGDLISSLKHSGVLKEFLDRGGKYIFATSVDNLYGTVDPIVLGQHIIAGKPITCEVTNSNKANYGGVLCDHNGFKQIVEKFRLSSHTNPDEYDWMSTNSMVIDANLDFDSIKWSWHRVKKKLDGRLVVQYERLLQDLTAHFQTQFIGVKRQCRYMPIKTQEDFREVSKLLRKIA